MYYKISISPFFRDELFDISLQVHFNVVAAVLSTIVFLPGVRVWSSEKDRDGPWFGVWLTLVRQVRTSEKGNGPNSGSAGSEFGERMGQTLVSKFGEETGPNPGLAGSEFGERNGPNPGLAGSEFEERQG